MDHTIDTTNDFECPDALIPHYDYGFEFGVDSDRCHGHLDSGGDLLHESDRRIMDDLKIAFPFLFDSSTCDNGTHDNLLESFPGLPVGEQVSNLPSNQLEGKTKVIHTAWCRPLAGDFRIRSIRRHRDNG
jgi:hypothetical protein